MATQVGQEFHSCPDGQVQSPDHVVNAVGDKKMIRTDRVINMRLYGTVTLRASPGKCQLVPP